MVKVLRVVILSLTMSLLFCVSAFAAPDYPTDLPALPDFASNVHSNYSYLTNDDIYFIMTRDPDHEEGILYQIVYFIEPAHFYYSNEAVYAFDNNELVRGVFWYWPGGEDPEYGEVWDPYWDCETQLRLTSSNYYPIVTGSIVYANCPVYDFALNPIYSDGYPESSVKPDPEPGLNPIPDPDPPYLAPAPVPDKPAVPSHSYTQSVSDDGAVDEPEVFSGSAMADLNLVVGSIFGILTQIYNLYAGTWLLTGFLMLWLIRRVSMLFQHL